MSTKLILPRGTFLDHPPRGEKYTLKELQEAVNGYIEIVPLPERPWDRELSGHALVVNEEGKLLWLPRNFVATALLG